MVNANTTTTGNQTQKLQKVNADDLFSISIKPHEDGAHLSKEGLPKNVPMIEFILGKVKEELRKPESHMYTNSKGKYKPVYELINDNKDLRDLLKKLNLHLDHHYEKARLKELHQDNIRSHLHSQNHKQVPEEKKLEAQLKVNQK